jgi:zinc transporter
MVTQILFDADAGLVNAFAIRPGQPPQPLNWPECQQDHAPEQGGYLWIHLNVAMQPAKRWLSHGAGLPVAAAEAMLDNDNHPHMVLSQRGFLLTLNDLNVSLEGETEAIGSLRIWVDRHRLITVRRSPKLATLHLLNQVERGEVPDSSIALFLDLVESVADNLGRLTSALLRQIDLAEDAFLAGRTQGLRQRLGALRREAVTLHRLVAPDRQAMARLLARATQWLHPEEQEAFRQSFEDLNALSEDVREAQDRAKVLQEEFTALLAEETNRNLYTLSIASVILLPMTLVTGYFGMNTGGLPFGGEVTNGTTVATVIMGIVGLVTGLWVHFNFKRSRGP